MLLNLHPTFFITLKSHSIYRYQSKAYQIIWLMVCIIHHSLFFLLFWNSPCSYHFFAKCNYFGISFSMSHYERPSSMVIIWNQYLKQNWMMLWFCFAGCLECEWMMLWLNSSHLFLFCSELCYIEILCCYEVELRARFAASKPVRISNAFSKRCLFRKSECFWWSKERLTFFECFDEWYQ